METKDPGLLLRAAAPTKTQPTFCPSTARDLTQWIAALPKANIGETSRLLYQALNDLNQVKLPSDSRLQLLELLRPEVDVICRGLEKHFINQPIVLGERARKVATLCQALQSHLAIGYKLVVRTELDKSRPSLLALALQRTANALYRQLERACMLYCPIPEGLWFELHQIQHLAIHYRVAQQAVPTSSHDKTATDIQRTYAAALLLGCARTNQMRQADISKLANALPLWSHLLRIQAASAATSLFLVAPQQDGPPRYRSLFNSQTPETLIGLDTHPLVDAISHFLLLPEEQSAQARLSIPAQISQDLLNHLVAAWGDISERTFQRNETNGELTVCIGMTALHFELAGKVSFHQVLQHESKASSASFGVPEVKDAWANAFDAKPMSWDEGFHLEDIQYKPSNHVETLAVETEQYPHYRLKIVNQSPGGYCMTWPAEVPSQLQTGELVGIQDSARNAWAVALVRWVRQIRGGGTQMGLEIITPNAQPCGLKLLRNQDQDSQYLRALLLPAIPAISRPASLITARLPFQEGHKVMINQYGEELRALLTLRQSSSGCINIFEYRELVSAASQQRTSVTASDSQGISVDEDFDSLWNTL